MSSPAVSPDAANLSESKRALLQKLLRADGAMPPIGAIARPAMPNPAMHSSAHPRVPVVTLQAGTTKRPFFYLHVHWQGGAPYCFALGKKLGPDYPIYLLDPYRFDQLAAPPTIEEMAAAYIQSMRSVQPEGPYSIGGFCGASLVAYEMAQQLLRDGQGIELLVFVEPMAGPIRMSRLAGRIARRIAGSPQGQLDWFLRMRHLLKVIRRTEDEFTEGADRLMRRWCQDHGRRFGILPPAGALRLDWLATFAFPVSGYRPRPYPGRMTYILARDNRDGRRLWWGRPTPSHNVEIHMVPGDNVTCRTIHAEELTDRLRLLISRAQDSSGASRAV